MKRYIKRAEERLPTISESLSSSSPVIRAMRLNQYRVVQRHITRKDMLLLDAGCGDGIMLDFLGSQKITYVGVDVSRKNVLAARARINAGSSANLLVGDVENLPFRKSIFEFMILVEVLEHLVEPVKCLKEADRIVRSSGRVLITVPTTFSIGRESPISIMRKMVFSALDLVPPKRTSFLMIRGIALPHRDFTRNEIINLCQTCKDLKIIAFERFSFTPLLLLLRIIPERVLASIIQYVERVLQRLPIISSMSDTWLALLEKS